MNRSLLLFLLALSLLFVLPGCGGGQADDDDDTPGDNDNYGYWGDSAGVAYYTDTLNDEALDPNPIQPGPHLSHLLSSKGGPELAMNSDGNGIAIWAQKGDGYDSRLWSNYYDPAQGWMGAELVVAETICFALGVSYGASGNPIAVWQGAAPNWTPGTAADSYGVWASQYTPGEGWGTPEMISQGVSITLEIESDAAGNAMVVFEEIGDEDVTRIVAIPYTVDVGWGPPVQIGANNVGSVSNPKLAMNGDGKAVVVWAMRSDEHSWGGPLWSNYYTPGEGWRSPVEIEPTLGSYSRQPEVAIDNDGVATVVWPYQNAPVPTNAPGTVVHVFAKRFSVAGGWTGLTELTRPDMEIDYVNMDVDIESDASGNLIAVWSQSSLSRWPETPVAQYPEGWWDIWVAHFDTGSGWRSTEFLPGGAVYLYEDRPQLSMSPAGSATVVWRARDNYSYGTKVSHYTRAAGWANATNVNGRSDFGLAGLETGHRIELNDNHGIMIWLDVAAASAMEPLSIKAMHYFEN